MAGRLPLEALRGSKRAIQAAHCPTTKRRARSSSNWRDHSVWCAALRQFRTRTSSTRASWMSWTHGLRQVSQLACEALQTDGCAEESVGKNCTSSERACGACCFQAPIQRASQWSLAKRHTCSGELVCVNPSNKLSPNSPLRVRLLVYTVPLVRTWCER